MAHILVVDDDVVLLDLLDRLLTAAGHTVVLAPDGVVAEARARGERFDVILTDLVMPNREGLEFIIRLHQSNPAVGVIAMSGGSSKAKVYLDFAARLGAHETLAKPFTPAQLHAVIAKVVARGAA